MSVDDTIVTEYTERLAAKKDQLFDLYSGQDVRPVAFARGGGWTRGYRLFVGGETATGSSIGEDEIRLFFDLPCIIEASSIYAVGVAFGLSTFNLALARPEARVFAIDNYSKLAGPGTEHARALVDWIIAERVPNVWLHVGTSPDDTDLCLMSLGPGEKLSLVFIDGLHTNEAAAADYFAAEPYLDARSVVLWHNTYATRDAFNACFDPTRWDCKQVLHTYGVIGIYFNRREHPLLDRYLRDNCLFWTDWEEHLERRSAPQASAASRAAAWLVRVLRRFTAVVR